MKKKKIKEITRNISLNLKVKSFLSKNKLIDKEIRLKSLKFYKLKIGCHY